MHTSSLYWFTLTTRATSSSQKPLGNPLSNQTKLQNTTHQSSNLDPLKKHTTFGKPHQEYWSWTPCQYNNKNTEDRERITPDQSSTKKNTIAILFYSLKNPKLDVNLENLRSNLSNWIYQNCFLPFRNI